MKACALLLALMLVLFTAGCANTPAETTVSATTSATTAAATTTTAATTTPATTTAATTTAPPTTTTAAATTVAPATTAATTSATGISPTNTAVMYSSYAYMTSYDPARGWADFDYFNMLRGDDAVNWLVTYDGYCPPDAQDLVDDFADSEFIEDNLDTEIRTIDLRNIDLSLMYAPDGTMVTGATPLDSELIDLFNLYHVDSDLVLNSFFYYVTVVGGSVVSVDQVYWP